MRSKALEASIKHIKKLGILAIIYQEFIIDYAN